jgi:hypothetical protein
MRVFRFSLVFSSAISGILTLLLLVALLLAGKVYLKAAFSRLKSAIGEKKTRKTLKALPDDHVVLHDLLLRSEGGTLQIDHTVISRRGIFLIETKAYDGWIVGNEKAESRICAFRWCRNSLCDGNRRSI